jgi:hypothetical protein
MVALYASNCNHTISPLGFGICHDKLQLPDLVAAQLHPCQVISLHTCSSEKFESKTTCNKVTRPICDLKVRKSTNHMSSLKSCTKSTNQNSKLKTYLSFQPSTNETLDHHNYCTWYANAEFSKYIQIFLTRTFKKSYHSNNKKLCSTLKVLQL